MSTFHYAKNVSKLARQIGEILTTESYFSNMTCYYEYPVKLVNQDYYTNREHFDYAIKNLKVVIEINGRQHDNPTSWSGDVEDAIDSFKGIQRRDFTKKDAAVSAGWTYVEIPYSYLNKINGEILIELITNSMSTTSNPTTTKEDHLLEDMKKLRDKNRQYREELNSRLEEQRKKNSLSRREYLKSDTHQEQLEKIRKYRREQYLKTKARKL
jgi:very-short-patch-repair endonuclease